MFISVDLPLPDAPMIATYSPRSTRQADAAQRVHRDVAELRRSCARREDRSRARAWRRHARPLAGDRRQRRALDRLGSRAVIAGRRGAGASWSPHQPATSSPAAAAGGATAGRRRRHRRHPPPASRIRRGRAPCRRAFRSIAVVPVVAGVSGGRTVLITTCSPALRPLMICVRLSPRRPTTTCCCRLLAVTRRP